MGCAEQAEVELNGVHIQEVERIEDFIAADVAPVLIAVGCGVLGCYAFRSKGRPALRTLAGFMAAGGSVLAAGATFATKTRDNLNGTKISDGPGDGGK